jgi:hypothetical protein
LQIFHAIWRAPLIECILRCLLHPTWLKNHSSSIAFFSHDLNAIHDSATSCKMFLSGLASQYALLQDEKHQQLQQQQHNDKSNCKQDKHTLLKRTAPMSSSRT